MTPTTGYVIAMTLILGAESSTDVPHIFLVSLWIVLLIDVIVEPRRRAKKDAA